MAAGTVAAMVLVPGTALAQETTPIDNVVETLQQMAGSAGAPATPGVPAVPGAPAVPAVPGVPALPNLPGVPVLPLDSDSDSPGHETPDPVFPDHGSGYVGNVDLNDQEILDLTRYDATIEDDGSTHSDSTVLALFGNEIVGSHATSNNEQLNNPTSGLCDGTGGAICLSLLYHYVGAFQDEQSSAAAAAGGVLGLCLLGDNPTLTASYECKGLIGAGVAEGLGRAERDAVTGHTKADSFNELVAACLLNAERNGRTPDAGDDAFACKGLLGAQVLHSDSASESKTPATERHSWLVGLDSGGKALLRLEDPAGISIPPACGDGALLCLFLNQGESFIFPNADHPLTQGAASAQEALHLDLLNGSPLDILVILGQAESIAHLQSPPGCNPGEKGPCPPKPECSDGIDNDGDGKIDFPADLECESPEDNSEADGKKGEEGEEGGLAKTGSDIAPLLAGAFLLIGMGTLTVAATRRRVGKHTI
jgi:hypothetical protein